MIEVHGNIHINAPVEQVFDLMADPAAKAELNPLVEPIQVEVEDGERLHLGSRCHYRLQFGSTILDYSGHVTAFEDNRLIESCTDSEPPIRISVEIAPEEDGTRLTQTERFEPNDAILESIAPQGVMGQILQLAYRLALFVDIDFAVRHRAQRERTLISKLNGHLEEWLLSIKTNLEN